MYQRKLEKTYVTPFEHFIDLVGSKWNGRVLGILHMRPNLRYGDIKRLLPGITDPVLSDILKLFQKEGIITRTQLNTMPIRVEYSLTDLGWELVYLCQDVCKWSCKSYPRDPENEYIYCLNCTINPLTSEQRSLIDEKYQETYAELIAEMEKIEQDRKDEIK